MYYINGRHYSPVLMQYFETDTPANVLSGASTVNSLDRNAITTDNCIGLLFGGYTIFPLYDLHPNSTDSIENQGNDLPEWLRWVVGGLAFAGIVVASVLTCGVAGAGAAAVGAAMLTGGVVSAGINVVDQLSGGGEFDWTKLAISTLSGTAYGLVVGLSAGAAAGTWNLGAFIGHLTVAGSSSLLNSWNENATVSETIKALVSSLLVSGVAQGLGHLAGRFGPQVLSKILPSSKKKNIVSILWSIPAIKTGVLRFTSDVVGTIINDIF